MGSDVGVSTTSRILTATEDPCWADKIHGSAPFELLKPEFCCIQRERFESSLVSAGGADVALLR